MPGRRLPLPWAEPAEQELGPSLVEAGWPQKRTALTVTGPTVVAGPRAQMAFSSPEVSEGSGIARDPPAAPVPKPPQLLAWLLPPTVRAWNADAAPGPIGIAPTCGTAVARALGTNTRHWQGSSEPLRLSACCCLQHLQGTWQALCDAVCCPICSHRMSFSGSSFAGDGALPPFVALPSPTLSDPVSWPCSPLVTSFVGSLLGLLLFLPRFPSSASGPPALHPPLLPEEPLLLGQLLPLPFCRGSCRTAFAAASDSSRVGLPGLLA